MIAAPGRGDDDGTSNTPLVMADFAGHADAGAALQPHEGAAALAPKGSVQPSRRPRTGRSARQATRARGAASRSRTHGGCARTRTSARTSGQAGRGSRLPHSRPRQRWSPAFPQAWPLGASSLGGSRATRSRRSPTYYYYLPLLLLTTTTTTYHYYYLR